MAKLKLILEAAKLLKKYWPYLLIVLLMLVAIPLFIVTILFSGIGIVDSDDPAHLTLAAKYREIASEEGLQWQQLLAIDLAYHEMDEEQLDPDEIIKSFVYYVNKRVAVYNDAGEFVRYKTERKKKVRTYYAVMEHLNFTDEQREMAEMVMDAISEADLGSGGLGVSADVMAFEPLVRKYAIINGIEEHVALILALIQQESGGRSLDVMQSSESKGLPPNSITNPEESIEQGVKYFAQMIRRAEGDVNLALQAYNFGSGFIRYALNLGGYSKENAISFSEMMALRMGWDRYGDVDYVEHVLRYMTQTITDGEQIFVVDEVYQIMRNYLGMPYVWGGRNPSDGGFDCSGLMEYAFALIDINISGTAESQYNKTVAVSESDAQPGDLVFFKTTDKEISHVGMYIGNDKFINANNNGVEESSMSTWRELYPFKGFRRIQ